MNLQIKIFNTFDDEHLTNSWKKIFNNNNYFVQNSYEWCSIWWNHFKNKNMELYIIAVCNRDNIIAIAPMLIEKRLGFKQIKFISTGLTDFHQFLIENDSFGVCFETIIEHLTKFIKWDLVFLDQVNDEDILYKYLCNVENIKKKYRIGCVLIDINELSWDEYIKSIDKHVRNEYNRRLRRLEEKTNISFISVYDKDKLKLLLDEIFKVHVQRWDSKSEDSKLKQNKLRSFIKEAFLSLFNYDSAALYVLKDEKEVLSYQLGFVQNNTFYCWNSSFNIDYYEYSPGQIIKGKIINELIKKNYKTYNFMRGDYEYKKK